eukprot:TRINITY_DN5015_c0_g1_i1.p2 TRINITY_DN5015_c0_g1~~TRINITY_DN5015_c0_g1_i1.p2  ORF type:complete len:454 (-),score=189.85 TRINITY_DN5015_c0_g1_i1:359-1720(-)
MEPTRKLAEFVCQTNYDALPAEVTHQAKLCMLDTLGCALAGYTLAEEEVEWALKFVHQQKSQGPATIFCDGSEVSAANAALVNGVMAHTIDFDDTHMGSISHLGAALLATAIAVGQQTQASGQETIAGFVLGFEVGARLGRSVMPSHYKFWHPTATLGGVAAAVAAAKIMGLNPDQMEQVIGLAADATAGMRYGVEHGDFSKALHPGFAALKAVIIGEMAKDGATGPKGFLEYPSGFCNAYSTEPKLAALTDKLGEGYEIMEDSIKSYPTIQCSHTSIDATLKLMQEHGVAPQDIAEIDIVQTATVPGQGCNYEPGSPLAARLSTPFCVALAVLDGEVSLQKFTSARLQDPAIKEVMAKVKITGSEEMKAQYPETIAATVTIATTGGEKFTVSEIYPKGDPRNRLSDEEMTGKFRSLAEITLPDEKVTALIEKITSLDQVQDLAEVTALIKKD